MDIKEIASRNYKATVRRKQIFKETSLFTFYRKIDEERKELLATWDGGSKFDPSELADIALVCFSIAEHFGVDLQKEMEKKMKYNEEREN